MLHALFGFDGRMNRAPYWGWSFLVMLLMMVPIIAIAVKVTLDHPNVRPDELQRLTETALRWPLFATFLAATWPLCAIVAKRLHDLDRPTWLVAPVMLPSLLHSFLQIVLGPAAVAQGGLAVLSLAMTLLAFGFAIWLGFVRGSSGPNRFGPDPLYPTIPGPAAATAR